MSESLSVWPEPFEDPAAERPRRRRRGVLLALAAGAVVLVVLAGGGAFAAFRMWTGSRTRFVALVELLRDRGEAPADIDAEAAGAALFGLVQGYMLQRALLGTVDRERYVAGVAALPMLSRASDARD
jgi:hypothetical protein